MTAPPSMSATRRKRPPQRGQSMTSNPNVPFINAAQHWPTARDRAEPGVALAHAGSEGNILRYAKSATAQGQKEVEKVPTPAGEAYFDRTLPAFIGRVGNQEVQIETTIQPVPREAMIAVGTRILETLSRK